MDIKTVELESFNLRYASGIDFSATGVMFSYNDPLVVKEISEQSGGIIPEDVVVSVDNSGVALHIVSAGGEEIEGCFLLMGHRAGSDLVMWVGANALGLSGEELQRWAEDKVQKLCFSPTDGGGIFLDHPL